VKSVLIDSDILIEVSRGRDVGILTKWPNPGLDESKQRIRTRSHSHTHRDKLRVLMSESLSPHRIRFGAKTVS
jgi:hypothetical protein